MSIDLYDSELLEAEKVLKKLNEKRATSTNLEAFRTECVGRFAEIGLVVDVKVWSTSEDGVFAFDLEIQGRTHPISWDPDRQVHEVRTDILNLLPNAEKGQWIKSKPGEKPEKHPH